MESQACWDGSRWVGELNSAGGALGRDGGDARTSPLAASRDWALDNPRVYFLTFPRASGAMATKVAAPPSPTTFEDLHMQSTPPGEPSPFDDGELYDIMCQGLDDGIDFYVGLAPRRRGRSLTSHAGPASVLLPMSWPGSTPTDWTSSSPCSTRHAARPPLSGYRRFSTAATWPTSSCRAAMP